MKKQMKKQITYDLVFVLLLVTVFFLSGYHEMINSLPRGIHFIRQTDSLSFTDNYYLHGYSFFEPHVYNLTSKDGRASCEFPILYYLSAELYSLFGEAYWIPRGINLLVFSGGIFSFYSLAKRVTGQWYLSTVSTLLLISSTIVLYYGANFLVDIAALGCVLIGINMYQLSGVRNRSVFLIVAYLFFLTGALLKITFAIAPIALFLLFIYREVTKKIRASINIQPFPVRLHIGLFAGMSLFVSMWYIYSRSYNLTYGDNYFLTSIVSFWQLSSVQRDEVYEAISGYWRTRYYYPQIVQLFLIGILCAIVFRKRLSAFVFSFFVIGVIGLLCYFFLFFGQFKDHDYYFLPFVPFCGMILILIIQLIGLLDKRWLRVGEVLLTLLCLASFNYSVGKLKDRYVDNVDKYELPRYDLYSAEESLSEMGIANDSRVLVIGDATKNGSLYFLKRSGYTFESLESYMSSPFVQLIDDECDYLVVRQEYVESVNDSDIEFDRVPFLQLGQWYFYRIFN
jgi:4-amino-4-deoxy-L-arabinose transferase-like glycosyltransferase